MTEEGMTWEEDEAGSSEDLGVESKSGVVPKPTEDGDKQFQNFWESLVGENEEYLAVAKLMYELFGGDALGISPAP